MLISMLSSIFNDPVALSLIVGGIVLVAVGLILYFFVFRKKVKAAVADNQVKKAKKTAADNKAKDSVASVFKSDQQTRQTVEEETESQEEMQLRMKKTSNTERNEQLNSRKADEEIRKLRE